ncbi:hypothetical protein LAZ67_5000874 [Cordylochernes scorpioides]|uniref:Transposase n=1 Tax=Cordylochernes scorpioides TaxID=51811 RepID=A0ABY6KH15_9ARAC|nr:hypothetical protein LAZ67_5000874 [Cordylochernes scorpioides]
MLEDRRITVRKLCDLVPDVSKTTIDKILREHLGYSKVCAIWVPKMLTEDHKRQRVDAAQKFLDCHKTDGEEFLDSIVTGDVTWVHHTTPETKEQSKQWKHISSPKPLKFKQTLSAGKIMATVFWNRKSLLFCDFMRQGTTINFDRYCETLKQLRRAIQNKRRGMLTKGVRVHHDNAQPHTAHQTTALIEEFEWELVSHPPYSPDVAPTDFHFFPDLKKNLVGTQFQDDDELKEVVLGFLRGQAAEFFDSGFHKTISRRLVANGLHSCRPLRRLPLTPPNRRQRLEWCRARSTWMTEWHRVVFSDESRFCLSSDSRRVRVWRRRGERSNPAAIVERPTVRQRGIMVWGAIAYDSRSPLLHIRGTMTAQRYVDDVLRPVTLPYLQGVPNALYQQDNARPHTARISQQALQDVQMLPWPPYSPDLSPIEHVWDIIGRRLHALPQPRSEDELWQMVEREWRAIPQDAIRTLIDSLPRRVAACIAVRGGPTCY